MREKYEGLKAVDEVLRPQYYMIAKTVMRLMS